MSDKKVLFEYDREIFFTGGILLYLGAWVFYFLSVESEITTLGLMLHYLSLCCIALGAYNESKRNKMIIFFTLYGISLFLDYPLYEFIHGLSLGLFYYSAVNIVHISLLLSMLYLKKSKEIAAIIFMDFFIGLYLWRIMSIFPTFVITIAIFVIDLPILTGFVIYYFASNEET